MKKETNRKLETLNRVVAAYVRVSSIRQATEGDSLEAQQNMIGAYARQRQGIDEKTIVYYIDAGKSAKNQNRPKLQELKRDIQAGKIGKVIVWKLDRITRSLLDFAELWAFFREHGVEISSLNEDFDTSGSMGRAMLHIIMVFAQLERELIGERTRAVMQDRIDRGLSNGGIRWGYQHDKAQNGKLVPDPQWAPIIREHFFDAFDRLGSAGAVQRHLAGLGIVVPKRQSPDGKIRGGKVFTKQQVTRVLTSEVYLGTLNWGVIRKEGCHEPLVSKAQFDRVQAALNHNRKTMRSREPMGQYPFLLKGILRCKCGRMMTSYFSTGHTGTMHPYYCCTERTHRGKRGCDAPYVPAKALDEAIVQRVLDLSGDQKAQDEIVRMAIGMAGDDARRIHGEIDQVRKRQGTLQVEINNLVRALAALGAEAVDSVKDRLLECEAEKRTLATQLAEVAKQEASLSQITGDAENFLNAWRQVKDMFAQVNAGIQREIVQHFVERLVWIPADPKGKSGTYTLVFFPEVVDDRDGRNLPDPAPPENGTSGRPKSGLEAPQETRNAPVLRPVRNLSESAREVGLEPTSRVRFLAGNTHVSGLTGVDTGAPNIETGHSRGGLNRITFPLPLSVVPSSVCRQPYAPLMPSVPIPRQLASRLGSILQVFSSWSSSPSP